MEQQNGVQSTLAKSGIMFKIDSVQNGLPEIISEETFVDLLKLADDQMPSSIDDVGYEHDDLDDDDLTFV